MLLRNLRVIAFKLNKLFEIWISHHFVTKNNLWGIRIWIRATDGEVALLKFILSAIDLSHLAANLL